ncbi:MAG: VWA domain-containing protein [Anaerolineales bacterium]|nr:VWA domain-containing protein [Anaerolineales bacterium]
MSFLWPVMLCFLGVLPLMVVGYVLIQYRRRKLAATYSALGFGPAAQNRALATRRHVPALLSLFALALLIFALARPQAAVALPRQESTVILVFDISGSMAATDIEPTRMEAAKAAAQAFIERQPENVRLGVVAFSDSGFSIQMPTQDEAEILSAINRLAPERGTSLARGITAALDVLVADAATEPLPENYTTLPATPEPRVKFPSAAIVLLTDGENTVRPDPLEAALAALESEVRIYTVGVGSPQGAVLELDGFSVHTQLDEATLKEIASVTRGEYFNAQSQEELTAIYEKLNPQVELKSENMEVTALFAGVGLAVLLAAGALSFFWFNRWP